MVGKLGHEEETGQFILYT